MSKLVREYITAISNISYLIRNIGADCCSNISFQEFFILSSIKQGRAIGEIQNNISCTKSGFSKIISKLEAKNYLEKIESSTDRRRLILELTTKGELEILNSNNSLEGILKKILEKNKNINSKECLKYLKELNLELFKASFKSGRN